MNPFFDWLIKSSVSLVLLYSVFKLTVSRDKIFIVNRFVLMGVLVVSTVLPLINISVFQETIPVFREKIPVFEEMVAVPKMDVVRKFLSRPVSPEPSFSSETVSALQNNESIHINPWLAFYLFVILFLSVRLFISILGVIKIIRRAEKQPFQKVILAIVKDFIQPFSFLQHIVISEKDYTENKEIVIAHEYAHIKNLHAIDLLICELFTALFWFNPFMWLLRRDLKLIHEYQADQAVLNKGIDAKKYQLLVLEKAVGERRFAMANHFKQKPILKRIKMMKKKNQKKWTGLKLLLFIPIILLLLQACSYKNYQTKRSEINGTYRLVYEEWVNDGVSIVNNYDPNTSGLKTWSDTYFLWVNSSPRGMAAASSFGGGTYVLDGNNYVENTEHQTTAAYRGGSMKLYLEMKRDTVVQIWPVDNNFKYDKNNCQIQKYVRVD